MPPFSSNEISLAYKTLLESGELAPKASSGPCKNNTEKLCDWLEARNSNITSIAPQKILKDPPKKQPQVLPAEQASEEVIPAKEEVHIAKAHTAKAVGRKAKLVTPVLEYYAFPPIENEVDQTKIYEFTVSKTDSGDPSMPFLAPDPLLIKSMKGGQISSLTAHIEKFQRLRMPEFMRFMKGIEEGDHVMYKNAETISVKDISIVLRSAIHLRTDYLNASEPADFLEYKNHQIGCKYIVCGDLHGGIHALLRHLQRWHTSGIIDKEWTVQKGFTIVFLGDLLDRGGYSFEVATTVLWLYSRNHKHQRVWICRGNHEEHAYRDSKPGFGRGDERLDGVDREKSRILSGRVKDVFRFFPSAIVLKACGKNVLLVHGGICETLHLKKPPHKLRLHGEHHNIRYLNAIPAYALRWNDFRTQDKSTRNKRRPEDNTIFKKMGMKDASNYMKNEDVSLVLRGHQDCFNFQIMLRHTQMEDLGYDLFNVHLHEEYMQHLCETFESDIRTRRRLTDSQRFTASFFLDESRRPDLFLPIFTTSSARIRPSITADCFLVLRFDLSKKDWQRDNGAFMQSK